MRVRLISLDGGETVEVDKELILVGRKEECDLRLDHKSISKLHCVIVKTDGLLLLRDLGSTNGTRVNGQRVRRAALLPNDQLHIASLRFKIQFSADEEPIPTDERTQQVSAKELEKLKAKVNKTEEPEEDDEESSEETPAARQNVLPDVYPESSSGSSK
jgi:pSer/pThr/pTyr-binding forkhead associated (FHA) protein